MAASFYTAAQWMDEALRRVHGDVADSSQFLAAIRAVKLSDSPFGPLQLDGYGDPVENIYLRKVVAVSGPADKYAKTWNVVTHVWPHVSQFWTYNPKEYLKQPVYSTTFQGIKQ
jgi:branched-chain amino acid transport system substrate-binding protein